MSTILPAAPAWVALVLASLVLAVTPGPGVLYIVTRTLSQGRRAGFASVAGVALGNLGNAVGASLGLAALFAVSSLAFTAVKWVGAAYLIFLGVKALRAPALDAGTSAARQAALSTIFRDGFFVALLNPKTALFFAAFLPQFMDPAGSAAMQGALFGALFVLIAACTDAAYVMTAAAALPHLGRVSGFARWGRYAAAGVYVALGLFTLGAGQRTGR
jgi:threonine/homoserine/homoserine lactone efflux protein